MAGSAYAFVWAVIIILAWGISGPVFHFSDTWQLVINTGTTIITFLMVFLIQNTQNRDSKAVHLKLDELLNSSKGARPEFVDLEELSDEELDTLDYEFKDIHVKSQTSPVMQKLHKRIAAEKDRRHGIGKFLRS